MRFKPYFYRDAGDGGGNPSPATPPIFATPTATPTSTPAAQAALTLEDISKLLDNRQARAESAAMRSLMEQSGLSEAEVKALFEQAKAEKAKQLPEAAQKQIEEAIAKADAKLILAEVKTLGVGMGLVDADDAVKLWDGSNVKVSDSGTVEGVKEALEALKIAKPHLFGAIAKPTGQRTDVGGRTDGVPSEENPWAKETWNMGKQAQIYKENPTLAKTLAQQAGKSILEG